jgi:hypothetical protein
MRMYRRLIVSIAAAAAVLAATPAFGQSFKPDSKAFGASFQQNTNPPPAMQRQPNTGLGFGIHFGGTWTSVSTDENLGDIDLNKGAGVVAGIFFGGNRDGRAGLQGEVSYLTKKVNFHATDGGRNAGSGLEEHLHPDSDSAPHQHGFTKQQWPLPVLPSGSGVRHQDQRNR